MFSRAYRAAISLPPLLWVAAFLLIPYGLLFCYSFWSVSPQQITPGPSTTTVNCSA